MTIVTRSLARETVGFADIHDLTEEVRGFVEESGLAGGIVTVFVPGSTGGVTTLEFEPGLKKDLAEAFERIAPSAGKEYHHDAAWGDGNGFSHLRAALVGPSLTVPFREGRLLLGTWQQIVLLDFDNRPRQRKLVVQIMGE